ncbi:MAG: UbiA family prenyltransferase [Ferruginibacter sp.]
MLQASTIQLLRFHFSVFLMPVYWFALSQTPHIHTGDALLVFCILHLLLYPASNGYNSYMDRDTGSIGGIKNPLAPTPELYRVSLLLDALAIALSFFISIRFASCAGLYMLASRAYSFRGIRLKKYPVGGYLTVIIFQGALVFYMVMHGCSEARITNVPLTGMLTASLLIGGFYPLTQIYQHEQDATDGVRSISSLLGYRGTFIFTGIVYFFAMCSLAFYLTSTLRPDHFFILQVFFIPVLLFFFWWMRRVWKDPAEATFRRTMQMNILASLCTNFAFITLLILEKR